MTDVDAAARVRELEQRLESFAQLAEEWEAEAERQRALGEHIAASRYAACAEDVRARLK